MNNAQSNTALFTLCTDELPVRTSNKPVHPVRKLPPSSPASKSNCFVVVARFSLINIQPLIGCDMFPALSLIESEVVH